jgi:hypothetical protein
MLSGSATPDRYNVTMTPQQRAESLGLVFEKQTPGYLNLCIRTGNQLLSSGHVSSAPE